MLGDNKRTNGEKEAQQTRTGGPVVMERPVEEKRGERREMRRGEPMGGPEPTHYRTAGPLIAGILAILTGVLNTLSGIGISVGAGFLSDLFDIAGLGGLGAIGAPFIIWGVLSIIGGIFALIRRIWPLAMVGGITSVFPSPFMVLGIPALILIARSKHEFYDGQNK